MQGGGAEAPTRRASILGGRATERSRGNAAMKPGQAAGVGGAVSGAILSCVLRSKSLAS